MSTQVIWCIVPDHNYLTEIVSKHQGIADPQAVKDRLRGFLDKPNDVYPVLLTYKNYLIVMTSPNHNNTASMVLHINRLYACYSRLDYIFLLSDGVVPDVPIDIEGGYGASDVQLQVGQHFMVRSTFDLPSPDGYVDCHGSVPMSVSQLMTYHRASDGISQLRLVNGFSSSGNITRSLFNRARNFNYVTAVADKYTATFYFTMYCLDIRTNYASLVVASRVINDNDNDHEASDRELGRLTDSLFTHLLHLLDDPVIQMRPVNIANPPAPAAASSSSREVEDLRRVVAYLQSQQRGDNELPERAIRSRDVNLEVTTLKRINTSQQDLITQLQSQLSRGNSSSSDVRRFQEENRRLVEQLSRLENAKTELEREHMDIVTALTNENAKRIQDHPEDELTCKLCFNNKINTMVLPCKHAVICAECSDRLAANPALPSSQNCVSCRTRITSVHKFFLQ